MSSKATSAPEAGQTLAGKYLVEEVLGVGGQVADAVLPEHPLAHGQLGRPPTGKEFEITVIDVARYGQDGRLVEHWGVPDRFGLLEQLGLLALPGKPAAVPA